MYGLLVNFTTARMSQIFAYGNNQWGMEIISGSDEESSKFTMEYAGAKDFGIPRISGETRSASVSSYYCVKY
jgi:hypothetical protein